MNKLVIGAVLMVAGLTACGLAVRNPEEASPREVSEFVCYTDGKLSERHVGVVLARNWQESADFWIIEYHEGTQMKYLQQRGETCGLESYIPPTEVDHHEG